MYWRTRYKTVHYAKFCVATRTWSLKTQTAQKCWRLKAASPNQACWGKIPMGTNPCRTLKQANTQSSDREEEDDAGASKDGGGEYSNAQLLLVEIQDKNYAYLTTHLRRILAAPLYVRVKTEEIKYANNEEGIRDKTARKRMPWSEYKLIVLELLPVSSGLYELSILLTLHRENNEPVSRWMQRLRIGKNLLESAKGKYGISLPDAIFCELGLRYYTQQEVSKMARAHQ